MARPIKNGLDYFPLDVDMDDKVELIEAKYGIEGFGVLIKLYQKIYKLGYFIEINEEILLLTSKRIGVDIECLNQIINDCVRWGIFDEKLYKKYKILTSKGIQSRFLTAKGKRKEMVMISEYVFPELIKVFPEITLINQGKSTQSKVKESKVKDNNIVFSDFWDNYDKKVGIEKCKQYWNGEIKLINKKTMTDQDRSDCIASLNSFVLNNKEKKYRPHPSTYLYQRRWMDELSTTKKLNPTEQRKADMNTLNNIRAASGELIGFDSLPIDQQDRIKKMIGGAG